MLRLLKWSQLKSQEIRREKYFILTKNITLLLAAATDLNKYHIVCPGRGPLHSYKQSYNSYKQNEDNLSTLKMIATIYV